jgi:purine-binding chemotaxis protein CheW
MPSERSDLWSALLATGHDPVTDADYEHGYRREIRSDLRPYVTFAIGREQYGIPIEYIVEISKPFDTTLVPRTPDFVLGIGNVRGTVMPVIDLPQRLKLGSVSWSRESRILIVRSEGETYGLAVDRVFDVIPIAPENLEDAPGGIGSARAEFIYAIGRVAKRLIIVVDLASTLDITPLIAAHAGNAVVEPGTRSDG